MVARILDAGPKSVDRQSYTDAIRSILDGHVDELAHDRNSICYRVCLGNGPALKAAVVKVPRPGPQRTNEDATFSGEARILRRLPSEGITNAPELLARVEFGGEHYLFTTELPGKHPDAQRHPLDAGSLQAVVEGLYAMDRLGLLHYDLKPANILVDRDRASFLDFEFARFEDRYAPYAPATAAFCEDFNVSGNPFFPARSNVANFEFRSLHRYLLELAATRSAAAADEMLGVWLRARSHYHRRMATFLADFDASPQERIGRASGISPGEARRRLDEAVVYENLIASLLKQPDDAVARTERALMAFRCAVFERNADDANRWRRATLRESGNEAPDAHRLPEAYRQAVGRTAALVGRSVHPAARIGTAW